jgi:hypothetical protein
MSRFLATREPDWDHLSLEWERSGLPQREFCDLAGVSYTAFCHHRSQRRKRERQAARLFPLAAKDEQVGDFITVDVESEETGEGDTAASTSQSSEVELELPFGIVLRIRGMAPQ